MKYKDNITYKIFRPIITLLFKFIYKPEIMNSEFIPNRGKIIIAGNHTNIRDCLLLISSTKRQIHFLAKDELMKGVKKFIFKRFGIIPVNRRIKDKSVIPIASKYLENDLVIGIFPEGTTEKGSLHLLPFKIGAVKLSKETKTDIVPFKIIGEYKLFKKNIKIIFDRPFRATNDLLKSNEKLYNTVNSIGYDKVDVGKK